VLTQGMLSVVVDKQTDRRTNRQNSRKHHSALCRVSRGRKTQLSGICYLQLSMKYNL